MTSTFCTTLCLNIFRKIGMCPITGHTGPHRVFTYLTCSQAHISIYSCLNCSPVLLTGTAHRYCFTIITPLLHVSTQLCHPQGALQFITPLLNVSTLLFHYQEACNQYLAKLHKYFICSCWQYNFQFHICVVLLKSRFKIFKILKFETLRFQQHKTCVKHLNCKLYHQQLHLKYLCNLARR